jgi:hypothetical protein
MEEAFVSVSGIPGLHRAAFALVLVTLEEA